MLKFLIGGIMLTAIVSCVEEKDTELGAGPLDDPLAPHAWHLNNIGQTAFSQMEEPLGWIQKLQRFILQVIVEKESVLL